MTSAYSLSLSLPESGLRRHLSPGRLGTVWTQCSVPHVSRAAPPGVLSGRGGCGQAYRDLAKRHPSFRERSENTELIVDITMQPFRSFQPDGIILFRRARNPPLPHTHTFFTSPRAHGR